MDRDRRRVAMPRPSTPSTASRPWPVSRRFYVSFHDLDVVNHLNHAAYLPYMETLRCDYYLPLLHDPDPARIDLIIAEVTCRYLVPVPYGTELVGEVAPGRPLGRTSFSLLYRFTIAGTTTVTARGRSVNVVYDYAKAAKKEIPPERRLVLERDAVDPAGEGW